MLNLGFILPTIGPAELIVVLGIAVLIFGGRKIPELGKGLGEGIRNFKQSLSAGSSDEQKKTEQPAKPPVTDAR